MCTVSVISLDPTGEAIRLVCNRDELRTRAPALPPEVRTFGQRRAVLPTDPISAGTWIAASDVGLVFALLNHNPRPAEPARAGAISRGRIIPQLIHALTIDEAIDGVAGLRTSEYPPFRLVVLDRASWCEVVSDGGALRVSSHRLGGAPVLFTSSGLGDALVEAPRRRLFEQLVPPTCSTAAAQDAFHAHAWPGRERLSVMMSRPDARTVSRTVVELGGESVRMEYEPLEPRRRANNCTLAWHGLPARESGKDHTGWYPVPRNSRKSSTTSSQ